MTWSTSGQWPSDLGPKLRAALAQAGTLVGKELVKRVTDGMKSGGKSGRVYNHRTGGTYQASAPGQYSAVVTGRLLGSINYAVSGSTFIRFYATAGHAGYQEFGTSKMAARENLKRAIAESDATIQRLLEQIIWRALG